LPEKRNEWWSWVGVVLFKLVVDEEFQKGREFALLEKLLISP
jgi:hypothetical protein